MSADRPHSGELTGVCHLTTTVQSGCDPSALVVRLVISHDVESQQSIVRHAVGPDQACQELRRWIEEMCESAEGTPCSP